MARAGETRDSFGEELRPPRHLATPPPHHPASPRLTSSHIASPRLMAAICLLAAPLHPPCHVTWEVQLEHVTWEVQLEHVTWEVRVRQCRLP